MKPKILFVHEHLGFLGGAEQNIFYSSAYLKNDYDLIFLHSKTTEKDVGLFCQPFQETYQIDFMGDENLIRIRTAEILQKERPDLIYMHKCLCNSLLEVFLESKVPILRMVHDHEVYCLRGYKYFPISRKICTRKAGLCCLFPGLAFVERDEEGSFQFREVDFFKHKNLVKLDQQCERFLSGSHYMKNELANQGYDINRIQIIPPVVPNPPNNHVSNFSEKNILIFAGQIIRGKGLDCLIKALALVKTDFQLIVFGKGSHQEYCEKLVQELRLDDKISFKGFVTHEQMQSYILEASVGVVPSVWPEPFGMVGIELMNYGLPVVGFDSGGIGDWLKNEINGYLVPWMDIPAMANKIEYLLNHKPEAKTMGEVGRAYVRDHYNFDKTMQQLSLIINECLHPTFFA